MDTRIPLEDAAGCRVVIHLPAPATSVGAALVALGRAGFDVLRDERDDVPPVDGGVQTTIDDALGPEHFARPPAMLEEARASVALDGETVALEPPRPDSSPSGGDYGGTPHAELEDDEPRDPMVPEDRWHELNREQRSEVAALVQRIHTLGEAYTQARNPTDAEAAKSTAKRLQGQLLEEFGITLNPDAAEETAAEAAPPPVLVGEPYPGGSRALRERRRFLERRGGLPAEAARARAEELAEIDRRLRDT